MRQDILNQRIDQVRPLVVAGFVAYIAYGNGHYCRVWYEKKEVKSETVSRIEQGRDERVVIV